MSPILTPSRPATGAPSPTSIVTEIAVITARNLRKLVRVPTLIALATVQPILFVALFTYTFGGAVHPGGTSTYLDYLLPGLFVLALGFGASQSGVAIAEDLADGMIDRFRVLPMHPAAVLVGRSLADAVRNLFVVALMVLVAIPLGFRFHTGPAPAAAAIGLAVFTGFAFSWLNLLLGLLVRDAESASLAGIFPVVILVFTSSTLVPVATMPGWLQTFAAHQPVTATVDALRALCLGGPTSALVWHALAWIAAILALAIPVTITCYNHTTSA